MTIKVVPTKTPQNINGNLVYLNEDNNLVIEHPVRGKVVSYLNGDTVITDTKGVVITASSDGSSSRLDTDGTLITVDSSGKSYYHSADGVLVAEKAPLGEIVNVSSED